MNNLLVHDITIVSPGTSTDRYGNAEKDWTTATETTVKGWVSQNSSTEDSEQREAQVSDWILYLNSGVTVDALDRIEWGSLTFEVVGPINPAWTPRGEHHQEVPLRVVTG